MNQINKILYNLAQSNIQIGEIRAISNGIIPSKWALCDGSIINRSTYSQLFSTIGTAWGGGDGETTFALPDMQGRTLIGIGESSANGHTNHILGEMGGEESHSLITEELGSHQHNSGHGYYNAVSGSNTRATSHNYYNNDAWSNNRTSPAGSNSNHNTMQPYLVCNYIIYTGVN